MSDQNPTPPADGEPGMPSGGPQYGGPTPGQPPAGGMPPSYGDAQYGGQPAQPYRPTAMTPSDENTWSALAHFGGLVISFLAPLIVLLVKGNDSPRVRANAVEALNFQLSVLIYSVISSILIIILIGLLMLLAVGIGALVLCILAGIKALNGEDYRYPLTIRLVK
jgi:uncharacterized Tic20 family protein